MLVLINNLISDHQKNAKRVGQRDFWYLEMGAPILNKYIRFRLVSLFIGTTLLACLIGLTVLILRPKGKIHREAGIQSAELETDIAGPITVVLPDGQSVIFSPVSIYENTSIPFVFIFDSNLNDFNHNMTASEFAGIISVGGYVDVHQTSFMVDYSIQFEILGPKYEESLYLARHDGATYGDPTLIDPESGKVVYFLLDDNRELACRQFNLEVFGFDFSAEDHEVVDRVTGWYATTFKRSLEDRAVSRSDVVTGK